MDTFDEDTTSIQKTFVNGINYKTDFSATERIGEAPLETTFTSEAKNIGTGDYITKTFLSGVYDDTITKTLI
jgi:hypothetical protein